MSDDGDKTLASVLSYLVGRQLKLREILEALQMSRTRYYEQMKLGKLHTADNLIRAARNLDINEVDLLARYGLIRVEAALDYAEEIAPTPFRTGSAKGVKPAPTTAGRLTTEKPSRLRDLRVQDGVTPL